MKWLIEKGISGSDGDRLIELLGNDCIVVKYNEISWFDLPYEDFMFYGSLESHKYLMSIDHPYFCNFFHPERYLCSNYYPQNYSLLLNKDCIFIPFGLLKYSKDLIFNSFMGAWVFLRPNSGCKEFTGTLIGKKHFEKELTYEVFKDVKDEELIMISSYKEIPDEYRMIVSCGKLITSNSSKEIEEKFKKDILPAIKFDEFIFTVDYCYTYNKIVEINSFSCAGLYGLDYTKIINYIKETFK